MKSVETNQTMRYNVGSTTNQGVTILTVYHLILGEKGMPFILASTMFSFFHNFEQGLAKETYSLATLLPSQKLVLPMISQKMTFNYNLQMNADQGGSIKIPTGIQKHAEHMPASHLSSWLKLYSEGDVDLSHLLLVIFPNFDEEVIMSAILIDKEDVGLNKAVENAIFLWTKS